MPIERSGSLPGVLTVLFAASLFGTLGVLSRTAYSQGLAPFAFVAWRATVGAIGLWAAILLVRGRATLLPWSAMSNRVRWSFGLAMLVGAGLNLAIFYAFGRTTIALALLGFYTYPALVAGASIALGRERLDAGRLLALVLALVGMAFVVLGGVGASGAASSGGPALAIDPVGLVAALVAAACQAAFVLVSREYAEIPTEQAMGTILLGTGLIAAVVTVVLEGPAALVAPLGAPALLGLMLVVGIFAASVPSSLFLAGLRRLGGIRTGIVMLAEPVVGVLLAAIFLAEAITPLQAAGGLTILVAAFLVQRESAGEPIPAVSPVPGGP